MFQECLDVYKDKVSLDNFSGGYNHFFIMQHLENDNILPILNNNLIHISTYNLNKNEFLVQYFGIGKPQIIEIRDKPTLEIMINKKIVIKTINRNTGKKFINSKKYDAAKNNNPTIKLSTG